MVPFKSRYQGCGERRRRGGGTDPVRAPAPSPRTLSSGVNSGSSNRGHGSAGRGFTGLRWVDHVVGRRGRSPTVRPSGEGARAVLSTAPPWDARGQGGPRLGLQFGSHAQERTPQRQETSAESGRSQRHGPGELKTRDFGGGGSAHRQAWGGRGWRGC